MSFLRFIECISGILQNHLKSIPYLRRWFFAVNRILIKLGADPLTQALMKDGTRLSLDLRNPEQARAAYFGVYEPTSVNSLLRLIKPDSVCLDVGANIGFYSVPIANNLRRLNGNGMVLAFEPHPANYQRLITNLELNGLSDYCTAEKLGLSSRSGKTSLTLRKDFSAGAETGNASILIDPELECEYPTVEIELISLDSLSLGRIDIIKLDIEGHEDHCLRGAKVSLANFRPTILMEVNRHYYQIRQESMSSCFEGVIPEEYQIFHSVSLAWRRVDSIENCPDLSNIFLVPAEKLSCEEYRNLFDLC